MVRGTSSSAAAALRHLFTIRSLLHIPLAAATHARFSPSSSSLIRITRAAAAAAAGAAPSGGSSAFIAPLPVRSAAAAVAPNKHIGRPSTLLPASLISMGGGAVAAGRRRSPRLNPSLLSSSASSITTRSLSSTGSTDSTELDANNSKKNTRAKPKPKAASSGRKGRGRPRKSADVSTDECTSTTTDTSSSSASEGASRKKRKSSRVAKKATATKKVAKEKEKESPVAPCLPRTREESLKAELENDNLIVIGVDEAGRGPLAGPVCAAAAYLPVDVPGITDSKKITKEEQREELYKKITTAPGVRWAAAIVDAKRVDEINILQATMEAMRMATDAVISPPSANECVSEASADRLGCYVVCGSNNEDGKPIAPTSTDPATSHYALIDGNRVPTDMPCDAEPMVKGDSREFGIGAASIIAKVTRDRLMHAYDAMYPEYNLAQHKGYPTAAHMAAVRTHGASPIHRRTFAPLKHMSFDEEGRIVDDEE